MKQLAKMKETNEGITPKIQFVREMSGSLSYLGDKVIKGM